MAGCNPYYFSYLVNYFKKEKNCRIVAYEAHDLMNRLDPPKISKSLEIRVLFKC